MSVLAALGVGIACFLAAGIPGGRTARLGWRPRRRSGAGSMQLWLQQAGTVLTPRQFVGGSLVAGLVAFATVAVLTGAPVVAIVPAAGVALLPRAYFSRCRARRLREVQASWSDGLRDLSASISAGRSLSQAVVAMATSGPEPLREAFARYPLLARMLGTVAALEIVKEELADPASDRVIEVLILAHERGGQIVKEILGGLVATTTRDLKADEEITSEGLEMKINARAVLVLPWLVLVMLTIRPGPFRDFYRTPSGLMVVVVGGLMSIFGGWLVGRLARDRQERRVFGSAAAPFVKEPA